MGNERLRMIAAALSIVNAIAAAVRSALGLEQAAERHVIAARAFSNLTVRHFDLVNLRRCTGLD